MSNNFKRNYIFRNVHKKHLINKKEEVMKVEEK